MALQFAIGPTDRQTDHATRSVTTDRIYVRTTAMRPNNGRKRASVTEEKGYEESREEEKQGKRKGQGSGRGGDGTADQRQYVELVTLTSKLVRNLHEDNLRANFCIL